MKTDERWSLYKQLSTGWRTLCKREDGANLVLMAMVIPVLLGFAGLAVDGSNIYYQSQRMQISADAAALGGARQLAASAGHDAVDTEIRELAFANSADAVEWEYINNNRGVHVETSLAFPAYFARIYGHNVFTVTAESEAQFETVSGATGVFPFTITCDCDDDGEITPGEGGEEEEESGSSPTPTPIPDNQTSPSSGTIQLSDNQNSSYGITYLGQTGNTWSYEVEEIDGRDLDSWLLNISSCLSNIVSSTPSGASIGTDSSSGVPGIKWTVNNQFANGTFSFTLDNSYPSGTVQALAAANGTYGTVSILGPICDGTNTGEGSTPLATGLCLPTLEFETDTAGAALVAGQIIDTEWAAWGLRVTTNSPSSNPAMIFNSANPTGGDTDLGSPNQSYSGPGVGNGGGPTMPGRNSTPLGKVLIVAESSNSANPDDRANGGTLILSYDYPVRIDEVKILDIDDASAAGTIRAYSDSAGSKLVATGKMQGFGDNSLQTVTMNGSNVRRLEISFPKSGAVASIVSCRSANQPTYKLSNLIWFDVDGDGLQDAGEPGIPRVSLELYVSGQTNVIATTVSNTGGEYVFSNLPLGNYEVKIAASNFSVGGALHGSVYSPKDVGSAPSAPTAVPTNTPTTAPTATSTPTATTPTAYCQVSYVVSSQWGTGFNADVVVTNKSSTAWSNWTLRWTFAGNQQITSLWNGTRTQTGQSVQVVNAGHNGSVQANGNASFGFQASYSGSNALPTSFSVNGIACTGSGGASATSTPAPTSASGTATPLPASPSCSLDSTQTANITSAVAAMNQYGLATLNNLQAFGESDHFVYIGNDLQSSSSMQFGTQVSTVACSTRVLTVVGSIDSGNPLNVQKGSLAIKGSIHGSRTINYNGGAGCGRINDNALSNTAFTAYMQGTSSALATIPANNVDPVVNAGGNLMFNVASKTANGLAIFDITGTQLFNSAGGVIEFNDTAGATTILVNVSGSSLNWTNGNMGNWLTSYSANISKVIWNFHQATSINTNSRRFAGAVLAPYADMNAGSGNLEGSVVVKNLVNAGEIHNPVFSTSNTTPLTTACQGVTPTPTPTQTPTSAPTATALPIQTATPVATTTNDDTKDSDFHSGTGRAPAIISVGDNTTVDGGFILPDTGQQSAIINLNDVLNSQYEVSLVGTSGNTWTYQVRKISGRDLSYWALGVVNCMDKIVSYTPTETYSNGSDATTGFTGLKWTVPAGFTVGTFSFTLDSSYQARPMQALIVAETVSAQVSISGPDCTIPNTETPSEEATPSPTTEPGEVGEGENCYCDGTTAFTYGAEYILHEPVANAPGNFGWLRWEGDNSSATDLADNINYPQYSPPVYIGDWVSGSSGNTNSIGVANALAQWVGRNVTIPIYDQVRGTGNNTEYRICSFAVFELQSWDRHSKTMTGTFVRSIVRSDETDDTAYDYGARDVRVIR